MPSAVVLEKKKQQVADLSERIKNSVAGVIVDYKGINVADDTNLRKDLREAGVEYTVVKNTILKRAAEDAGLEGIDSVLEGTTAIATSAEDYVAAARILQKFADSHNAFNVKSGYVQTIFQSLPDSCTCEGSKKDSSSSKWGNATDYAGCYAIHLVHVSSFQISHTSLCEKDKTNYTVADGAYQISLYGGGNYVYTRKLCRVHVRTDCVNMTACTCLG